MLLLKGNILSVTDEQYGDSSKVILVIESEERDKYNRPIINEVQLSQNQLKTGLRAKLEALISQKVMFPVFVNAWAGKRGANYTMYLSNVNDPKEFVIKA